MYETKFRFHVARKGLLRFVLNSAAPRAQWYYCPAYIEMILLIQFDTAVGLAVLCNHQISHQQKKQLSFFIEIIMSDAIYISEKLLIKYGITHVLRCMYRGLATSFEQILPLTAMQTRNSKGYPTTTTTTTTTTTFIDSYNNEHPMFVTINYLSSQSERLKVFITSLNILRISTIISFIAFVQP